MSHRIDAMVQYTECRNGAQSRDTGFTILSYCLSVIVGCLRDSLSVTGSGGDPVWSSFVDFRLTKFRQNFLQQHLKGKCILKILAACHSGTPFQPGALRTCVPCLMVNPDLKFTDHRCNFVHITLLLHQQYQFYTGLAQNGKTM